MKKKPDWSYQKTAIEQTFKKFTNSNGSKLGIFIPTGGGKTRIGLSIALKLLLRNKNEKNKNILWITNRKHLKTSGKNDLKEILAEKKVDSRTIKSIERKFEFLIVNSMDNYLKQHTLSNTELIVIDEAHHSAAPSYEKIKRSEKNLLFLTATPVRTDGLSLGLDEVSFQISYRQLFDRNVIIEPTFEKPIILPKSGTWDGENENAILIKSFMSLCENYKKRYKKIIFVMNRVKDINCLFESLERIKENSEIRIENISLEKDICFIHGSDNSFKRIDKSYNTNKALDLFKKRKNCILFTTKDLIGEGFNDPMVDTIVVTYPAGSILQLMQISGRALRYADNKDHAFIIQTKHSEIEYHFEQRWLYQDISDRPRPRLLDHSYHSNADLITKCDNLLLQHNIADPYLNRLRTKIGKVKEGEDISILFCGLKYDERLHASDFSKKGKYVAILIDQQNRNECIKIFNTFCENLDINKSHLINLYLKNEDPLIEEKRPNYQDMLYAIEKACSEVEEDPDFEEKNRNYINDKGKGTTFLTYVTFTYEKLLNQELDRFLSDCVNREDILRFYDEKNFYSCVKIPYPFGGYYAYLLNQQQYLWVSEICNNLQNEIQKESMPNENWDDVISKVKNNCNEIPIPFSLFKKIEYLASINHTNKMILGGKNEKI